jgi:four helix bundle protein
MQKFDLEERIVKFAEEIIDLVRSIKVDAVNSRIITQLVGSGGSIGANYCEATEGESKKDFIHKIGICKKEIKETRYWLQLLARFNPEKKEKIRLLWKEAHEFLLIFSKIIKSSKSPIIEK